MSTPLRNLFLLHWNIFLPKLADPGSSSVDMKCIPKILAESSRSFLLVWENRPDIESAKHLSWAVAAGACANAN